MKNLVKACIWVVGMGLLACCSKSNKNVDPLPQEDKINVAYGTDSKQTYNIYLPAGRSESTTPVVFFIYGGAWIEGDKDSILSSVPVLRQLFPSAAFVLFNYRLFNQTTGANKFPAQEQDVKACIEKVLNSSSSYGISKKFVVWGQSAGAHLAMLYAYKYGGSSFQPMAVVDEVGPSDMLSFYKQSKNSELRTLLTQLMGKPTSADTVLYNSSSPLKYINANSPPTLIIHGTADDIVPYQQAQQLDAKLKQYGVTHVYKLYPGQGHDMEGVESVQQVVAFLKTYLN
ncbi:alpha/beta hydrolase [Spirosoma sp. KNUC1025]|uniref:alpha/beta hydrolase n=1 Tax=Spirosoma sp. KNUC1025 TaxID=2894082 RepID=UPI00386DEDA1|nr:alpha/beta hydrolase [Spirosoma sp. KNUC1025]